VDGISPFFFFNVEKKDRSRQNPLDFVVIFIGFRDIRGQTRKLS